MVERVAHACGDTFFSFPSVDGMSVESTSTTVAGGAPLVGCILPLTSSVGFVPESLYDFDGPHLQAKYYLYIFPASS